MFQIEDGRGTGIRAGVTTKYQLLTKAVTTDALYEAAEQGDAFAVPTDSIFISTTTETPILFIEPHSEMSHINRVRMCAQNATMFRIYIGDDMTGTIESAGTVIDPTNMNTGSAKGFDGIATKGADGLTFGGLKLIGSIRAGAGTNYEQVFSDSLMISSHAKFLLTAQLMTAGSSEVCSSVVIYNHAAMVGGH